ncbi:hypothetical protein DIPPA_28372 [Diplonema papillatum]|nr:hypothetical protein DIPPA_28372 [Diplonema papillatum]
MNKMKSVLRSRRPASKWRILGTTPVVAERASAWYPGAGGDGSAVVRYGAAKNEDGKIGIAVIAEGKKDHESWTFEEAVDCLDMEEAELEAACVALERVTPGGAVKLVGGMDRVRLWILRQVACPHRLLRRTRRAQQLLGEARRKTRVEMPRTEGDVDGKVRERAVEAACKGGQRETRKRNLEERLDMFGLEERDAGAQGDCQFRAVSYAIHGTAAHHAQLRRLAVESLAARDITGRVEGCAKQYLARMARLGTWGDHLTLQALAWEVGRRVVVFELAPDDTMRATVLWPGETGKIGDLVLDERDIKLSYTGSHYRAVRWREEGMAAPVHVAQVTPQLNVGLPLRTNNSGPERPTRRLPIGCLRGAEWKVETGEAEHYNRNAAGVVVWRGEALGATAFARKNARAAVVTTFPVPVQHSEERSITWRGEGTARTLSVWVSSQAPLEAFYDAKEPKRSCRGESAQVVVQTKLGEGETREGVYLRMSKHCKRVLTRFRLVGSTAEGICFVSPAEADKVLKSSGESGIFVRALHEDKERSRLGMVWVDSEEEASKMAGVLKSGGIATMGLGKGADGKVAVRVERGKMDEACRALGRTRKFTVEGPPLDMTADEVVRSLGEQGWQAEAREARESRRGRAVWLVEALTAPPAMDLEVQGELWLVSQSMSAGVARGSVWDGSRSFMKKWETGRKEVQPATGQGRVFRREEFPVLGSAAQPGSKAREGAKNDGAKNDRGGGWGNIPPGAAGGAGSSTVAMEEMLKGLFEGLATKLTACLTGRGERDTGMGEVDTTNGAEVERQREQMEEMRKEMRLLKEENEGLKASLEEMKEIRRELSEQRRENEEIRETVREFREQVKPAAHQKGGKDAEMGSQASSDGEEGTKRKKQKGGNAKGKQK